MEDLLKVGVITTTHGIRGEVKVYPTTDADRFLDLEYVLLDTGREKRKLEIENVKYFKNLVILKFRKVRSALGSRYLIMFPSCMWFFLTTMEITVDNIVSYIASIVVGLSHWTLILYCLKQAHPLSTASRMASMMKSTSSSVTNGPDGRHRPVLNRPSLTPLT